LLCITYSGDLEVPFRPCGISVGNMIWKILYGILPTKTTKF
jgi:hypothetical protein